MGAYRLEVHASPSGSPYGDGSMEYPTRTLEGALAIVRRQRVGLQPVVIWLHEGDYVIDKPLELGGEFSGVTFAAWHIDGHVDNVTISGAKVLNAWERDSMNGTEIWVSRVEGEVGRTLYVNDARVARPRIPHDGYLRITSQDGLDVHADLNATLFEGSSEFRFDAGDLENAVGVEAWPGMEAVIAHFWIQERLPVREIDTEQGRIRSDYQTILCLKDGEGDSMARFYLDGVAQALGRNRREWLLDGEGTLATEIHPQGYGHAVVMYVPDDGDRLEDFEAVVPVTGQLIRIHDAQDVRFERVRFAYADWAQAPAARPPFQQREDPVLDPDVKYASDPQAASTVPGAIELTNTVNCAFVDCAVEHVGGYAFRLNERVRGTLISGCRMSDLGAGGVECGGAQFAHEAGFNTCNEVSDCVISDGGKVYPHAVGVLMRHGSHNVVAYNDISRFPSTAIACGWRWDYGRNDSTDNLIEGNHLHHLGGDRLNWFGAIYTLGVSPGTVVRANLIHDVRAADFGGWGILVDPATSGVEFTGNVIHTVSSECLHIKTGRANIVTGNVFAFGNMGQISLAVPERHTAAILTHNIIVAQGTPAFAGSPGSASAADVNLLSDANVIWDVDKGEQALIAADGTTGPDGKWKCEQSQQQSWSDKGNDLHSTIRDPRLMIHDDGSITIQETPLWFDEGIPPIFEGTQGPRPEGLRRHPQLSHCSPYEP